MKEHFLDKKFGAQARGLLGVIHAVLEKYAEQGYDLSLRQLYYQLVAQNVVENTERSYKNIGNLVSDARLAGLIDWDAIEDRGRNTLVNSHWDRPADILQSCVRSFALDKWQDQPCYVEVMVEKQALEGVLHPVCRELDIPFTANKGYSSSSALYACGKRFKVRKEEGKECYIIYLGDHDPSGIDMTRDVLDRVNLFAGCEQADDGGNLYENVEVQRVALNMAQIKTLRPPKNPAKLTDSRADGYVAKFGPSSWELDAIEPSALAKIVKDAVYSIRVADIWEASVAREEAMKAELAAMAKKSKFK